MLSVPLHSDSLPPAGELGSGEYSGPARSQLCLSEGLPFKPHCTVPIIFNSLINLCLLSFASPFTYNKPTLQTPSYAKTPLFNN